jgi:methyl-accepting chemotaxis protein
MRIKTRLSLNVVVVAVAIVIIVAAALVGTREIDQNITELTQKTTPYQLKALNQQREMQAHATNLTNLSASKTLEEYKAAAARGTESLGRVRKAFEEMARLKGDRSTGDGTIAEITQAILDITEKKIKARDAAQAASKTIQNRLSESSKNMKQLGVSIGSLQQKASGSLINSVDSMMQANQQQTNLSAIRDGMKDLTLLISKIPVTHDKRSVAVLRDGVTKSVGNINKAAKNLKGSEKFAADIIQKMNAINERTTASRGLAFLQIKNIGEDDEKQKEAIETRVKEVIYELSYILPTVEKEISQTELVLGKNSGDMTRNIDSFKGTNHILTQTSNLSLLSTSLVSYINESIHARDLTEFSGQVTAIENLFGQARTAGQALADLLRKGNHAAEQKTVAAYIDSISSVSATFSGSGGAADRVRAALKSSEDLDVLNEKMRSIAGKYLEESDREVKKAGINQSDVVATLNSVSKRTIEMVMGVGLLVIVVTLILGVVIGRSIVSPLKKSIAVIGKIADGDLTDEMHLHTSSNDEIGELARSVNTMRTRMGEAVGYSVKTSFKLSAGVFNQVASLETTTQALKQISSMVKKNAETTAEANELMIASRDITRKATSSMDELARSMGEIAKSSDQTRGLVKRIDEIAFKTNLLALNAAVEAARAGEAGLGFAVVADEVRSLARRAAEAAHSTSDLVEDITKKISNGGALVEETHDVFRQVEKSSGIVVTLMQQIAGSSREQSQGIDQVNRAVVEMNKVTGENAKSAEDMDRIMHTFKIEREGGSNDESGEEAQSAGALPPQKTAVALN